MISIVGKFINPLKAVEAEKTAFSGEREFLMSVRIAVQSKEKKANVEIFIPQPKSTTYQRTTATEIFPNPTKILDDDKYKNKVAYWRLSGDTEIHQKVKLLVKPRVFKSIKGDKGDYEKDEDYKIHTSPDRFFNFQDKRVSDLADKLIGEEKDVAKTARVLYDYVKDNLVYGNPIEGLYSSIDALDKNVTDCGGFDSLLGAMYRYVGIPARLVSGLLAGYKGEHMHAWLEFMLPGRIWVPADPSSENLRMTKRDFKPGGFARVGNDRIVFSYGSGFELLGKQFALLQLPVVIGTNLLIRRDIEVREIK